MTSTTLADASVERSASCAAPPAIDVGLTAHVIDSGGIERRYLLDLPDSYDASKPLPLVLALHPLNVDHVFVPPMVGFDDMQEQYDFVGVAPSGRFDGSTPFWDASPTDGNADVAFLADLLDELAATLCIDVSRVFATGMSNGAQMSSTVGCRLAGRVAAVAPVAGVEFLAPCDGPPVPVLTFHGTDDRVLPYAGGGLNATAIADRHLWKGDIPEGMPSPLGIDDSMARWAQHNGCGEPAADEQISPEVIRRTWPGCIAATVLYVVDRGGHTWPGKPTSGLEDVLGHTTTDIDATGLIFDFFLGPPSGTGQ